MHECKKYDTSLYEMMIYLWKIKIMFILFTTCNIFAVSFWLQIENETISFAKVQFNVLFIRIKKNPLLILFGWLPNNEAMSTFKSV